MRNELAAITRTSRAGKCWRAIDAPAHPRLLRLHSHL